MSVIIRLQNLPISANASNIRRFFGGLTIPEGGVHIVGGNDGDAFIAFATDEDARKAMLLDRQSINSAAVRLFLSSKTEMQSVIESARSSVLFSGSLPPGATVPVSQKTETIQALDVTTPTLPSSFSSYRNGATQNFPTEGTDKPLYPFANQKGLRSTERPVPEPVVEDDYIDTIPDRSLDRMPLSEPRTERRYGDVDHMQRNTRYDLDRNQSLASNYGAPPVREPIGMDVPPKPSDPMYRSRYMDSSYDRHPDHPYPLQRPREMGRVDPRDPHIDPRYNRTVDAVPGYDAAHSSPRVRPDRFPVNDSREFRQHNEDVPGFLNDRRSMHAPPFDRDLQYPPPAPPNERDFSVRPPWLNEDIPPTGHKRPFQNEPDEYSRKRRPANDEGPLGTDFVVRVTLPVSEVGVKSIFDVLRGVHIVPKWGIRMEEDALQRLTGYVFIMTTARDSFDRSLAYNGRIYKGKSVRIAPSTPSEFFRVTDSTFRSKCPPEVLNKLPPVDQLPNPPHHADGCLELAQIPSDCTQSEIVRFLGVPGLSTDNVIMSSFSATDRTAPPESPVRALITLPSIKDLEILLSARPRPLRPNGTLPPVRLTPISKLQLESYSSLKSTEAPKIDTPNLTEKVNASKDDSVKVVESLTCAHLTGLERPMRDAEALRLFPSVFIPGDAVHMVGPTNTSAYIDFISENNCRRAMTDINGTDSKAKLSHPMIQIEAISRSEMESRIGVVPKHDEASSERPRPLRDRDPREARNQWDGRTPMRHHQPPIGFRSRSPPRSKFEDPYYERTAPQSYEDNRPESFGPPGRRPRPTMDVPHSSHPPPSDYLLPHPVDHQPLPPPVRRPNMDIVTVFVENLPPTVTVEQLAGVMRDYYFVPGSVRVRRDAQGLSTGQALVDFSSTYDADRMLRELNGYRFAGRPMALRYDPRV